MLKHVTIALVVLLAPLASADMVITEWMYNGAGAGSTGEFVEFTNTGPNSVDMTGWSFDDDSRVPGTIMLSAFGVVAPGQSVILTDETAADFAAFWGLSNVAIIGGNTANLGRNDEINLYDAGGNLIDRLTYGDQNYPGTPRTQGRSCNIPSTDYGFTTPPTGWVLATADDWYGSVVSTRGEVGSPGHIRGYARSDFDKDGDVDVTDFDALACCMTGPSMPYNPLPVACGLVPDTEGFIAADAEQDGDVDLADFAAFVQCFSGAGNDADPACGAESEGPGLTQIILNGTSITVVGDGVDVDGATATITADGVYVVTGTLTNGQLVVNSAGGGLVEIILSGVSITNATTAPFYVMNAGHTVVVLADQTVNSLTDPAVYVFDPGVDEPNAALFSKDSLTISGTGSLVVHGNFNDGIASKDSLFIAGGTITVDAIDDGLRGKDYLEIQSGNVTVTSGGDGLKSDNADDPALGYIAIEDGIIHVTSGGDAIAAETDVDITGGTLTLTSGGGHLVTPPADPSTKAIKGVASVTIEGGSITIDASDDGVHSNGSVLISGGTLTIATHDDAVHSDALTQVNGGTINITTCYEGLEGANVNVANGDVHIVCSNDAITADTAVNISGGQFTILAGGGHNVTIPSSTSAKAVKGLTSVTISGGTFNIDAADDGVHSNSAVTVSGGTLTIATNSSTSASYGDGVHSDGTVNISGTANITVNPCYEGIEARYLTIDGGTIHVTSADDGINAAGGSGTTNWIHINGGYVAVNANGDGIDSNGSIVMTGGTVIVHGPTANDNGPIDYDTTFNISGGILIAAGSAGMAQAPSTSSTQRSVKITYSASKAAGTLAHIQTSAGGTDILTFAPAKTYRSLVFSAPTLTAGASFTLWRGGTCTGTLLDGLYTGGTYSGGTQTNSFTTSSAVTSVSAP